MSTTIRTRPANGPHEQSPLRAPLPGRQRWVNAARQLAELPWFLRNLAIKALLVAHLRRPTRLLGHDGETWPY